MGKFITQYGRSLYVLMVIAVILAVAPKSSQPVYASARPNPTLFNHVKKSVQHNSPAKVVTPISAVPDFSLPPPSNGQAPVLQKVPTTQKVVFLTIDDGATRIPMVGQLLLKHHVPASLFLNSPYATTDPDYFHDLVAGGAIIENHTINHPDLRQLSYAQQKTEICGDADALQRLFGDRPTLFRPPYGSFNANTLLAATDCGQKAVITWHAKANGGSMQYQDGNTGLLPGDIVLIHFRPEFVQDFGAFETAAMSAGLQPALLEDWLR